eukprot:CAMPEP_0185766244 /NCGR_PEP_ID=MMETSP1174-20130828/35793_1 /TAXON_ID=35687 /ORGANISM="Dictyocha speculum, Strain CCMP1381" /LENGTH=50 /DNA_ID=CAMNT_0028449815 /DNA_START=171 /DNA_END=320 /DNA_ORIENTATION=+
MGGTTCWVMGDVSWVWNHVSIAARSYVCPSIATTGSSITIVVMGQKKIWS